MKNIRADVVLCNCYSAAKSQMSEAMSEAIHGRFRLDFSNNCKIPHFRKVILFSTDLCLQAFQIEIFKTLLV